MNKQVPYPDFDGQKIVVKPEIDVLDNKEEVTQIVRPEMPVIKPQKRPL